MPLSLTVGAAVTSVSGPFPPNYPAGANGYTAAPSNPAGDSAGTLSDTNYYGSTIVAVANEVASNPKQLLLAIEGSHDVNFIGPVTVNTGDPNFNEVSLLLPFDSTPVTDLSQYDLPVTANGGAVIEGTHTKFGAGAFQMIGNGIEFFSVPLVAGGPLDISSGDWTIEFWIYLTIQGTGNPLPVFNASDWRSNNATPSIFANNSGGQLIVYSAVFGQGFLGSASALSPATWTHIAVVRHGNTFTFYTNGVNTGTFNSSNLLTGMSDGSSSTVDIGPDFYSGGSPPGAIGYIDEVRVTKGLARYTANFTPPSFAFPTHGLPNPLPVSSANFVETSVNNKTVSLWIWDIEGLGIDAFNSTNVVIGDTGDLLIDLNGFAPNSDTVSMNWTNSGPVPPANYLLYRGTLSSLEAPTLYQTLAGTTDEFVDTGLTAGQQYNYYVVASYSDGTNAASVLLEMTPPANPVISATFNCNCESIPLPSDGFSIDTLANIRKRMLIRGGYAAQANNPPPGMIALCNEFAREAQVQLYRQHKEYRNTRLYAWQMEINQRYYGFANDESDCRRLDPLALEWVGFEDLNQAWYPLICGIDPVLYTRAQISTGWPTHYEIRSCIEIFPAPRAPYTLWIKGRFGLDPFTADTDTTTVDSEAVFLLATGMLKAHYGQPDAQALLAQALNYTKYLVSGQHNTARYVPRTRVQTPMTPPRFLPLEE